LTRLPCVAVIYTMYKCDRQNSHRNCSSITWQK